MRIFLFLEVFLQRLVLVFVTTVFLTMTFYVTAEVFGVRQQAFAALSEFGRTLNEKAPITLAEKSNSEAKEDKRPYQINTSFQTSDDSKGAFQVASIPPILKPKPLKVETSENIKAEIELRR